MKKIVCVHLLNDFSGSPLVLSQVIEALTRAGHRVDLYTCRSDKPGFLSPSQPVNPGVRYFHFPYRYFPNKYLTLLTFSFSQLLLFFKLLKYGKKDTVFYINTLLPFGAALAGKMRGCEVIYHVHETSLKPPVLKKFLRWVACRTAAKAVFVSHFLREKEQLPGVESQVVYNALPEAFTKAADRAAYQTEGHPFRVLMACSLKAYKGVDEFVQLAEMLPALRFELVLNASPGEISAYFKSLPGNLSVFPAQSDVKPFYERASVVLNLSHPDKWLETFGMTLLEAMSYGIPVIAPPAGGPVEVVEDGKSGFLADARRVGEVAEKLLLLSSDAQLCLKMSAQARQRAQFFKLEKMQQHINQVVTGKR